MRDNQLETGFSRAAQGGALLPVDRQGDPSGSMKYIAEVYRDGKSVRRTLGEHQILKLQDAGSQAITLEGSIMFCRKSHFVKSGHNIVKI
jgi:hypothetical protein